MNQDQRHCSLPAPCIVESGILVNKDDIKRLINDLTNVRYIHSLDGKIQNEGEGWILEVFNHPSQATIVVNNSLYINIESFDYLQISQSPDQKTHFHLTQDNRQLTLIPLSNSSQQQQQQDLDAVALDAMLSEVLSAKWDVQLDEDF
jgi:7-keto-8-aminopelargonate synthetase-like enzyme